MSRFDHDPNIYLDATAQTTYLEEQRMREFLENQDEIESTRGTIEEMIASHKRDFHTANPVWADILIDLILWATSIVLIISIFYAPEIFNWLLITFPSLTSLTH